MKEKSISIILIAVAFLLSTCFTVKAETPEEALNQYISDLQRNPNDNALREKIITLVEIMKPAPVVPEEARRHFIKAQVLQKEANDDKGYELAINAYNQALLIAPWWPEAYNNLGFVLELAGRFDEAISAFKLYIATNPPDSRQAQDKIYAIEAKKEISAKESSPEVIAEKKKNEEDEFIKKLNGARYSENVQITDYIDFYDTLDIQGNRIVRGSINTFLSDDARALNPQERVGVWKRLNVADMTLHGRDFTWEQYCDYNPATGSISEDGNTITVIYYCPDYENKGALKKGTTIYRRER